MAVWRFGSVILAGMILAVSAAGCAPQGASETEAKAPRDIVTDLHQPIGSERWKVYRSSGGMPVAAGIADPAGEISLSVYCDSRLLPLSILITAIGQPALAQPTLAVAFEDGSTIDSVWIPTLDDTHWGYGLLSGQPGFWTAIEDLKRHGVIEATFSEGSQERRYRLTLSEADAAITYVEKQCAAE